MNRVQFYGSLSIVGLLGLAWLAVSRGATFNGYWDALWVAVLCAQMSAM